MKRFLCVYNPNSGSQSFDKTEISRLFADSSASVDFVEVKDGINKVKSRINKNKYNALIAAGGDGTVNLVVGWCVELNLPLGVLPVGTLNHFAKDANLPLEAEDAVNGITNSKIVKVDYCTVNGKVFINNSSIGLYPSSVLWRESNDHKYGKWTTAAIAFSRALLNHKMVRVSVEVDGQNQSIASPLIFIGNNNYEIDKVGVAKRPNINNSEIFVYAVCSTGPTVFIKRAFLNFIGRPSLAEDFMLRTSMPVIIKSTKGRVHVAVDGEVIKLEFPLKYEIFKSGLKICKPAKALAG